MQKPGHSVIVTPLVALAACVMLASCGGGSGSKAHSATSTTTGRSTTPSSTGTSQTLPPPSNATAAQQTQLLRDAAHGTWKGPFGTVEFKADGTATVAIKNCAYTSVSGKLGVVTPLMTHCDPATFTGPLKIDQQSLEVNPTNYNADLHAYVDSSGKLHVGLGTVAFLGPNRSGTAQLQNSETLTVKGGQCLDGSDEPKAPVNLHCPLSTKVTRSCSSTTYPATTSRRDIPPSKLCSSTTRAAGCWSSPTS